MMCYHKNNCFYGGEFNINNFYYDMFNNKLQTYGPTNEFHE